MGGSKFELLQGGLGSWGRNRRGIVLGIGAQGLCEFYRKRYILINPKPYVN